MIKVYSVLLGLIVIVASCKHEPDDVIPVGPIDPGDTNITINCSPDTTYFQNDVLPIFQSNCALSGCHDETTAQNGMILSSYSNILASNELIPFNADDSDIYEAITDDDPEDRMPPPPYPPLPADKITAIRDWINQGAKNNYCTADCDTTQFTFAAIIQPMINQSCVGCHNATLANAGVRLDSYEAIAAVASDGRLLGTISHASGFPPMPFNGAKLSDCKITQVRKWIEAGSQNN